MYAGVKKIDVLGLERGAFVSPRGVAFSGVAMAGSGRKLSKPGTQDVVRSSFKGV